MSSLLSIDPGLKTVGWAYWEGRELKCCGLSRTKHTDTTKQAREHWAHLESWRDADRKICEMMVWRGGRAKASPADLLKLNIVAGHLGTEWVAPSTWKGFCPKSIHQPRILKALTDQERALVMGCMPASLRHNVVDAVGIGLYYLGRLRSTK